MRRKLMEAHRLMADGQFAEAAKAFEQLSEKAKQRGAIGRAAALILQSARACLAGDDVSAAVARAGTGLQWLARSGRPARVVPVLERIASALRNKGYDTEAERLEEEVDRFLEEVGLSLGELQQHTPRRTEVRGRLPANCTRCGAPLIPDEVEWHDSRTAECPYCGSIQKTV
jgi:predicted Zn-ribbon and HTH transcriptional regulator